MDFLVTKLLGERALLGERRGKPPVTVAITEMCAPAGERGESLPHKDRMTKYLSLTIITIYGADDNHSFSQRELRPVLADCFKNSENRVGRGTESHHRLTALRREIALCKLPI